MVVARSFPAAAGMFLGVLLGPCGAQYAPGTLEMEMNGKAQMASLNTNVTIPCILYESGSVTLNISLIGVRWFLRRADSDKEDKVFEYNGGKQTQFRPGASISLSRLKKGNASLFLPFIQLQEGGEYRCEIIIPPTKEERTSRVDVVAQPSSIPLPPETEVEEKKVYIKNCTVAGFYPDSELVKTTVLEIIGNILPVICICFFVWILVEFLRKVAPVLSLLPETVQYLRHQEMKTFHFVIWDYRPKSLTLKLFLKTNSLNKKELLLCWRTQGMETEEKPESMQLMGSQAEFTLHLVVQALRYNVFGISGHLTVASDLSRFTEADLLLQVEHSALKIPLRRKIHLKVIAQPKLKKIRCSSVHLQPGESVTLTCRIHSFFPRAVKVSWYKEDRLMLEDIKTSEALETLEDGLLCSCTTKLEFSPHMEDLGKKFICKAEVEGGEPVERHWVLGALGESPSNGDHRESP
ncbi:natural cytotoxicity triggering receptor 3 ligand 1 [Vombatus ursinus]|uniref:Ig-like domain-containing protein n=2 Tax=Vombatus ursinus TaxID=29139 RepID=A0A4X2KF20_VOMUR|nr:natural cytotoxicity triggering receptor 3 ligand 1 [Vombatus ursinus]